MYFSVTLRLNLYISFNCGNLHQIGWCSRLVELLVYRFSIHCVFNARNIRYPHSLTTTPITSRNTSLYKRCNILYIIKVLTTRMPTTKWAFTFRTDPKEEELCDTVFVSTVLVYVYPPLEAETASHPIWRSYSMGQCSMALLH